MQIGILERLNAIDAIQVPHPVRSDTRGTEVGKGKVTGSRSFNSRFFRLIFDPYHFPNNNSNQTDLFNSNLHFLSKLYFSFRSCIFCSDFVAIRFK